MFALSSVCHISSKITNSSFKFLIFVPCWMCIMYRPVWHMRQPEPLKKKWLSPAYASCLRPRNHLQFGRMTSVWIWFDLIKMQLWLFLKKPLSYQVSPLDFIGKTKHRLKWEIIPSAVAGDHFPYFHPALEYRRKYLQACQNLQKLQNLRRFSRNVNVSVQHLSM